MTEISIRSAQPTDAGVVSAWLKTDPVAYRQYFQGLPAEEAALAAQWEQAQQDEYWVVEQSGCPAAIVMARGLDEGFQVPAFGVYVAHEYTGHGLARLALEHVLAWCRDRKIAHLMLTVSEEHQVARKIYEAAGFKFEGDRSPRGHLIYRKCL